jgi:hypothetical protein
MARTYEPLYVLILTYVWQELTNRCTYWYRHMYDKNLQTVVRIGIDICMARTCHILSGSPYNIQSMTHREIKLTIEEHNLGCTHFYVEDCECHTSSYRKTN